MARRAVALYRQHGGDRIVAEANQGGDMVEATIRMVDQNASFKAVHASRGKITRAEPLAALAEQSRIHLAGSFPELEDQLCTFAAGSRDSPDRMDAMVWAFTELMVGNDFTGMIEFSRQEVERMKLDRKKDAATIIMRAPKEVSTLTTIDGRSLCIPDDRMVTVTEADAKALERYGAGWTRIGLTASGVPLAQAG
jgi:coenzyme F420-reducing hydrogenase delta subunit